jgi:hypothetical protein
MKTKINTETKNILLTILLIAPLFVSGIASNQFAFAGMIDPCEMKTDVDMDGYCFEDNDCDDNDENVNPGETEIPYNDIDDDCADGDEVDQDNDGFPSNAAEGGTPDCNDLDETINPDAEEVLGDGVDQNCDGVDGTTTFVNTSGNFTKQIEVGCVDGLEIANDTASSCNLWINYTGTEAGLMIDTIPAHLNVTSVSEGCEMEFSNANGKDKSGKKPRVTSSTIVTCEIEEGDEVHIETITRESPSTVKNSNKQNKFSPTGCGLFEVNGGILFYEGAGPITSESIPDDTMDPIFVHTTPTDLDCDDIPNDEDVDIDGDGFSNDDELNTFDSNPYVPNVAILDTGLVGSPGGSILEFNEHRSTHIAYGGGYCPDESGSVFVLDNGYINVTGTGILRATDCIVPTLPQIPNHDHVDAILHCDEGDQGPTSTVPLSSSAGATVEGDFEITGNIGAIGSCTNATVYVESGPPNGNGKWLAKSQ